MLFNVFSPPNSVCPTGPTQLGSTSGGRVDEDPPWDQHVPVQRKCRGSVPGAVGSKVEEHADGHKSCISLARQKGRPRAKQCCLAPRIRPPLGGAAGALPLFLLPAQHYILI